MIKRNTLTVICFSLLITFLIKTSLFAQDFEVAPVRMDFAVEPGDMESKTITIRNHSNKTQSFVLTLGDIAKDAEGKSLKLPPGTTSRSCANWITVNPSFFELNPNEVMEVEALMQVPASGYSSRWAVIYVKVTREQAASSVDKALATGIIVTPRIAIYVYQSPASNKKYKSVLSNFTEITNSEDSLRTFSVQVDNIGDKRLDSKIYLVISNLETAKERKLEPVKVHLYPDDFRVIELTLPPDIEPGKYSLAAILDYGHRTSLEAVQLQIEIK